ncbi:MAG: exodeoxyribonuclease VII large subunit, partial [Hyphomicrobiaceae bacterium]
RSQFRAAARGLPRAADLLALPRQRFDEAAGRLGRALVANTYAHHARHARVSVRLQPRLIANRLERAHERADKTMQAATRALARSASVRRSRFERAGGRLSLAALASRVARFDERVTGLGERAGRAFASAVSAHRRRLEATAKLAASLSHRNVLARGFAIVRRQGGGMLRSAATVTPGDALAIEMADGRFAAIAEGRIAERGGGELRPAARTAGEAPRAPRKHRDGGQGSLF